MASRFSGFTSNGMHSALASVAYTYWFDSTLCSAEITFKTDPKNTDYAAEHGASRNFEPWREERAVEEEDRLAKLEEEENNPMKALENRTVDSKREMDILDALQDIRARNARNERIGQSVDLLERLGVEEIETEEERERKLAEEEDEKLVREVFTKIPVTDAPLSDGAGSSHNTPDTVITVKRKAGGQEPDLQSLLPDSAKALLSAASSIGAPMPKRKKVEGKNALGIRLKGKAKATNA